MDHNGKNTKTYRGIRYLCYQMLKLKSLLWEGRVFQVRKVRMFNPVPRKLLLGNHILQVYAKSGKNIYIII